MCLYPWVLALEGIISGGGLPQSRESLLHTFQEPIGVIAGERHRRAEFQDVPLGAARGDADVRDGVLMLAMAGIHRRG